MNSANKSHSIAILLELWEHHVVPFLPIFCDCLVPHCIFIIVKASKCYSVKKKKIHINQANQVASHN